MSRDKHDPPSVQFDGPRAYKTASLGLDQAALMHAAQGLGCRDGRFYVPKLLDFDPVSRRMSMEYLPGLLPLRTYLRQVPQSPAILARVGESLACCHVGLREPWLQRIWAPDAWMGSPRDRVFVHGDFNLVNVCWDSDRRRLVLLDWETSPALPFTCTWASRYLDLAQFLRSLMLQQETGRPEPRCFLNQAGAFLAGYQRESGMPLSRGRLLRFVLNYNRAVLKKQCLQRKLRSGVQSLAGRRHFLAALRDMKRLDRFVFEPAAC